MGCPICNNDLVDNDGKTLSHVAKVLLRITNPLYLAKSIYNVGKTIYFDLSDIPTTDGYLYCKKCNIYFIRCINCGHLNSIGSDIMVSPKKICCAKCDKVYVYATHPDPDVDHYC